MEEEDSLAAWIRECANRAMGKNRFLICQQVKAFLDLSGRNITVFTDNLPGKEWYKLFMKRHDLVTKPTEPLEIARALACSEPKVRKWFKGYEKMLLEEEVKDPQLIFNAGESGFPFQIKGNKIICNQILRIAYSLTASDKRQITTLMCVSAARETLPPYVLYPSASKNVNPSFMLDLPPASNGYGTPTGWMNQEAFFNWIHVFIPNLPKKEERGKALLVFNGHGSHVDIRTSQICHENNIVLYCLPPHTSHITQPLDVCVFGPFKANWKRCMQMFIHQNGTPIDMYSFGRVFKEAYLKTIRPELNIKGFECTGLWPCNAEKPDYTKMGAAKNFPVVELEEIQNVDFVIGETQEVVMETAENEDDGDANRNADFILLTSPQPQPAVASNRLSPTASPPPVPKPIKVMNSLFHHKSKKTVSAHPVTKPITPTTKVMKTLSPLKSKAAIGLAALESTFSNDEKALFRKQYEDSAESTDAIYLAWKKMKMEVELLQRNQLRSIRDECICTKSSVSARKHLFKLPEHPRQKKKDKAQPSVPSNLCSEDAMEILRQKLEKKNEAAAKKKENADKRKIKLALKMQAETNKENLKLRRNKNKVPSQKKVPLQKKVQSKKNVSSKEGRKMLREITLAGDCCAKCDGSWIGGEGENVWICCDLCGEWWHVTCTHNLAHTTTSKQAENMKEWHCQSCENENF